MASAARGACLHKKRAHKDERHAWKKMIKENTRLWKYKHKVQLDHSPCDGVPENCVIPFDGVSQDGENRTMTPPWKHQSSLQVEKWRHQRMLFAMLLFAVFLFLVCCRLSPDQLANILHDLLSRFKI